MCLLLEYHSNVIVFYARLNSKDRLLCRLQGKSILLSTRLGVSVVVPAPSPLQLGQVQVLLHDQWPKYLFCQSARFLDIGEMLRFVLIDGHEGFTSHLLVLKLTHDFPSIDCTEVKLELCVM